MALENGDVMIMLHKKVWRYNFPTDTFTRQQDMVAYRYPSGATTFYSPKHDGRHVIFIGAGSYDNNPYTCALLDYTITEEWEICKYITFLKKSRPFENSLADFELLHF